MKRRLIPTWLLGFALLAVANYASAQQNVKTDAPQSRVAVRQQSANEEASLKKVRPANEIEADIKALRKEIKANHKAEGFNITPYQERLAKLEKELKKANVPQK